MDVLISESFSNKVEYSTSLCVRYLFVYQRDKCSGLKALLTLSCLIPTTAATNSQTLPGLSSNSSLVSVYVKNGVIEEWKELRMVFTLLFNRVLARYRAPWSLIWFPLRLRSVTVCMKVSNDKKCNYQTMMLTVLFLRASAIICTPWSVICSSVRYNLVHFCMKNAHLYIRRRWIKERIGWSYLIISDRHSSAESPTKRARIVVQLQCGECLCEKRI
jgi:hypothetical protein